MICVNCALGILVLQDSFSIDLNINRDKSVFYSSNMIFALSTSLMAFIIEIFILSALMFVLYTGWLFIALTKDEKNEDFLLNEQIEISTKVSEIDLSRLRFKIKVYYAFFIIGTVIIVAAMTLAIGFVSTVIP